MKTAIFIRKLEGFNGIAKLYKLNPPIQERSWGEEEERKEEYQYVVVSAVVAYSGPETLIFGADEEGNIVDWGDLEGSYRGGLIHERALERAGYTVA